MRWPFLTRELLAGAGERDDHREERRAVVVPSQRARLQALLRLLREALHLPVHHAHTCSRLAREALRLPVHHAPTCSRVKLGLSYSSARPVLRTNECHTYPQDHRGLVTLSQWYTVNT